MRWIVVVGAILCARAAAAGPRELFDLEEPAPPAEASCEDDARGWPCVGGFQLGDTLERAALWALGAGDATHDQAAARGAGAVAQRGGVAFAGASALENRWLVDGVPIDGASTGAAGLGIPLAFLERIEITSGGAPASARISTGAMIDARLRRGGDTHELEAHAWFRQGTPARELRAVPDSFDPLTLEFDPVRAISAAVVAGGPLPHDRAWYVVGVAPTVFLDDATRVTRRLRDADGDGLYDRTADRILETDTLAEDHVANPAGSVPLLARVGAGRGAHDLELTALAQPFWQRRLSADGTAAATTVAQSGLIGVGFATWTSRWPRTELAITAGWHREQLAESGADGRQIATAYVEADSGVAAGCVDDDTADPYPMVVNCPVPTGFVARGGAGALVDAVADTPSLTASLARRLGAHRLEVGVTGEDARRVVTRRFTGGLVERRLADDIVFLSRYVETGGGPDDCGELGPCRVLDTSARTYRTRYLAAWVQDTWRPVPGLVLAAGLRWESMEVGTALQFRDELAPRLGVSFDPTRRGRARVFAAFTRSFAFLPLGFGPAVLGDAAIHTHLDSALGTSDQLDGGGASSIAAGLAPPYVDELVAGAEWVIADLFDVGAAWQRRSLWHGMEDVGDELVNPGLRRDSGELRAWIANAPDARLHLRAVWVRSRQHGNWSGPFDPVEGATLYRSAFDGSTGNATGRLPLDAPHRFFLEVSGGARRAGLDLRAGARFQITSGAPVSALAGPRGEVPLLPRGSGGRTPTTSAVVLHLAARRDRFELALDLLDLFDRRAPAAVDQRWTTDGDVAPIEGGTEADLVWLRDSSGGRVRPNPGYRTATRYAAPLVVRLSLSAQF